MLTEIFSLSKAVTCKFSILSFPVKRTLKTPIYTAPQTERLLKLLAQTGFAAFICIHSKAADPKEESKKRQPIPGKHIEKRSLLPKKIKKKELPDTHMNLAFSKIRCCAEKTNTTL